AAVNGFGWTPLHTAAAYGFLEGAEALLKAGASVVEVDNEGRSPLHLATRYKSNRVYDALMAHGALDSTADHQGNTPGGLRTACPHSTLAEWNISERRKRCGEPS
ncbi:MAG: ankyrin repeat domain-containing protein, partial [Armatimonadota bacterium]